MTTNSAQVSARSEQPERSHAAMHDSYPLLPTQFLPSRIRHASLAQLKEALEKLYSAYAINEPREEWIWEPDPRREISDSCEASESRSQYEISDAVSLRAESDPPEDMFETQYVRTWLSALIQYGCKQTEAASLVDDAASLLVHLAGKAASGERWCTYYFFLSQDGPPQSRDEAVASIRIRDAALTEDALGIRTWGAAPYLTRRLIQQYADSRERPTKILELGAGTGLVGLGLASWLEKQQPRQAKALVTLTDHHANVLANLSENVTANGIGGVCVRRLDWQLVYNAKHQRPLSSHETLAQTLPQNNESLTARYGDVDAHVKFDLLVAADCIYDPQHASWIHAVAEQHLSRPSTDFPNPQLHLLIPIRATHLAELASVYDVFSAQSTLRIVHTTDLEGHDDFGPVSMCANSFPLRNKGSAVSYRHMIVEWTHASLAFNPPTSSGPAHGT